MAGQLYATNSLGGYYSIDDLTKELRYAVQPLMTFRKFCKMEPAAGKNRGDVVLFDKVANLTSNGGTIAETSTMPKTQYTVTQGSLTMTERGVAVPFTQKLENLAIVNVPESIKVSLRNSMAKVLDSAAGSQFQLVDYKCACVNTATTSFYAGSSAAGAAAVANMSDKNVRDIIDRMKILNIPAYDGSNYKAICSTNSVRGLYDFFEAKAMQTTMSNLTRGSVGTYYKTDFIEETNLLVNTKGTYYGEAIFFGEDMVREGVACPEEIRLKISTDYGRDQGLAWYYLGGFKLIWDGYTADGSQVRGIHVTSS